MQEERLIELSKLIGIDSKHIVLRYDDLEYFTDKEYEVIDLSFTILDEKEKPFSIIKEGLPKLKAVSYGCNMVKGNIHTSPFLNIGGPSRGLSFYIGGEMIEKSINNNISSFKFGPVEAFYYKDHNTQNHDYYLVESKFEVSKDKNDHYWLKADFNDFKIPNGILENPLRNKNFGSKSQEMIYGYQITFRFTLLSMDASLKGEAFVFAIPFENFHEGMAYHNVSILEDDSELEMAMQREMEEALKQMNMK